MEEKWDPDALLDAASRGALDDVKRLLEQGHSVYETDEEGDTVLHRAALRGHIAVISELLRNDTEIDACNKRGETALLLAVDSDCLGAVQELVKCGAAVDAASEDGMTPLLVAAGRGYLDMVSELIKNGADVHIRDKDGRSGLHRAAASDADSSAVTAELLLRGVDPAATTADGKVALSIAVEKRNKLVVRELLLATVLDQGSCSDRRIELFVAATMGDLADVEKQIGEGEPVDATTTDGRTPLFYAAEFGHMDVVKSLLNLGATSAMQSLRGDSSLEVETPLSLASRAGHMEIFEALVKAGAPVNVRSRGTGETPLISAARWDFIAGVQLLLSNGGALRNQDVQEVDGCSLIPGTLETMKSLCAATVEFESICSRVVGRLRDICCQLQVLDPASIQSGALVTFVNILFRFCNLQLKIEKRKTPLSRFIGSRAVTSKIYDFHEELDHFADLLGLVASSDGIDAITTWKAEWGADQSLLTERFSTQFGDDERLMQGCELGWHQSEPALLLQSEFAAHAREGSIELQEAVRKVRDRFLVICRIEIPVLPLWFISREDVEMPSWKIVWLSDFTTHYEGEWRKTSVRIETCYFPVDTSASRLFELSHPNVAKLFGACNIGLPYFFVYELMRDGRQLLDVLHDNDHNRSNTMWKCLHQAALGLRYFHHRGLAHGQLRPENILVGSKLVTKLTGFHNDFSVFKLNKRSGANWQAKEMYQHLSSTPSAASDIYAFGMCIWETLTRELPWKNVGGEEIEKQVRMGKLPDRPSIMTDDEWDLITKMCKHDATERVSIDFVVNRLKKFEFDSDQRSKRDNDRQRSNECPSISEHLFSELDGSMIPETLKRVALKCERLEEEDQWMAKSVLPALEFIFNLLQQQKTASDVETVQFCSALSRFERLLRIADSENLTRRYARSRKVAEANNVVYAELDRLLLLLEVSAEDPIRRWKHNSVARQQAEAKRCAPSVRATLEGLEGGVSVEYFDTPFANHQLWKQANLKASQTVQPWTLPLEDVLFKESDELGSGAFGKVFKGSWLGTPVVVKFMGYEEDKNTIHTDLLLHEVRVWHRLNHPHVLRLYGANHQNKRYFVCEFASGGDLLDFLKMPGNEKLVWQKLYEAALGLQYLHGQNVAHNDLKCDNIMVGADGNAKLIDFGLSCLLHEAEIKIEVKKMGAVHWRSPEYLTGGKPSRASDVYSFAMCIIEVISGDIPWGRQMIAAAVKFQLRGGKTPNLPLSMNAKQHHLIKLMTKNEPSERVRMGFVVDKLSEIAREESSGEVAP